MRRNDHAAEATKSAATGIDATAGRSADPVRPTDWSAEDYDGLALPDQPLIGEGDWVNAGAGLVDEVGPEAYMRNLLSILKDNYPRGWQPGFCRDTW